jgi:integrase
MGQWFAVTRNLSSKVFIFPCYSMGLRLGEGIRLTVGDIDVDNMRAFVFRVLSILTFCQWT